jgi:hypothetical protein
MSKWIRRVVALLSMSTLLGLGGCGLGGLGDIFNFQRILEAVVVGNVFD